MTYDHGAWAPAGWLKTRALGSTALPLLLVLSGHPALAANPTPPAAGSLPGSFFPSSFGVTYTGTGSTSATIHTTFGVNTVLQWGGATLGFGQETPPGGLSTATNAGFSIGSGGALTINGAATSVLVSDITGSPSQIYGALHADTLAGPLYVANPNGVIVGSSGIITAPAKGVGLLGYGLTPSSFFGGTVTIDSTHGTGGTGPVTVMAGAGISNGPLLVADNGTVNIGAVSSFQPAGTPSNFVLTGYGFTTAAGSVKPTAAASPLPGGAASTLTTTTSATAKLNIDEIFAGGAFTNTATNLFTNRVGTNSITVNGLFTNSGNLTETGELGNVIGGLVNIAQITDTGSLTINSTAGNVQSTGVLNVGPGGHLSITANNVDVNGVVQTGATLAPLSSSNPLKGLKLATNAAESGGVVDIVTPLYNKGGGGTTITGNAIRVLSGGGVFDPTELVTFNVGTKASAVADPFYMLSALNYTFSLFPGTTINGAGVTIGNPTGNTAFSNSPGLNLNGVISSSDITITANNINSNNGLNGGFQTPNGGTINLTVFGNANNPNGAANNSSTAFQYNYLPVIVGTNGLTAGTATISLKGPSPTSTLEQNVNLLVDGNVTLQSNVPPQLLPTPVVPYANNHLVVTATGNIALKGGVPTPTTFYWPGLLYMESGATLTNPTAAPNGTASITVGGASGITVLSNVLPGNLTTASVGGQTGHGGIFFLTNNLNLGPAEVVTSNDSWVNFVNAATASSFATTSGGQFFYGAVTPPSTNVVKTPLPAADFQP